MVAALVNFPMEGSSLGVSLYQKPPSLIFSPSLIPLFLMSVLLYFIRFFPSEVCQVSLLRFLFIVSYNNHPQSRCSGCILKSLLLLYT